MSFKDFLNKKNSGVHIEKQIDEFRDNLLADLSKIVYLEKQKIHDIIVDTLNFEEIKKVCESVSYPKILEFEIDLKSKKIPKIIEHLNNLDKFNFEKNIKLDEIKNIIFEYILNLKNNNLDSAKIDQILENKLNEIHEILSKIESKIKNVGLLESHKIHLRPRYENQQNDYQTIEITIGQANEGSFRCIYRNNNFIFEGLTVLAIDEKTRQEINDFYNALKKEKPNKLYETFYFEWPEKRANEIFELRKRISWGVLENIPTEIELKKEAPQDLKHQLWEAKVKYGKANDENFEIIWLERINDGPREVVRDN